MKVKILGVSGSPRKAATRFCIEEALSAAEEIPEVTTELIDLRGKEINNCIHCDRCIKEKVDYCPAFDDDMNDYYDKILAADGFIFASPVYQMSPTAQITSFINRHRPLGKHLVKGDWSLKVGGAIAVGGTRNGGQETTLESLNNFFMCQGMVVVGGGIFAYNGGTVWSNDKRKAGAREDEKGLDTVRVTGRRVAAVAMVLKMGQKKIEGDLTGANLVGYSDEEELQQRMYAFRHR